MTVAEQIKWDFKTNGDLKIRNKNGKLIYWEDSDGFWSKYEYDSKGNEIYWENSNGFWAKREYDSRGKLIYYKNSNGDWIKREYNSDGNEIYWEDSDGVIIDIRPKSCEGEEIVIEGVKYKLTKV